jgi:hypothetical protein
MSVPDSTLKLQQKLEELEVAVRECFISQQPEVTAQSFTPLSEDTPGRPSFTNNHEQKKSFGARVFALLFGSKD